MIIEEAAAGARGRSLRKLDRRGHGECGHCSRSPQAICLVFRRWRTESSTRSARGRVRVSIAIVTGVFVRPFSSRSTHTSGSDRGDQGFERPHRRRAQAEPHARRVGGNRSCDRRGASVRRSFDDSQLRCHARRRVWDLIRIVFLTMETSLAGPGYSRSADVDRVALQFVERAETIPGVESAAMASALPLFGLMDMIFDIPGRTPAQGAQFTGDVQWRFVTSSYFDVHENSLISRAAPRAAANWLLHCW